MAENSKIGWTNHTMNFWWGCHKVSAECHRCYIGGIMRRAGREPFGGPMRTVDWSHPYRWNRQAAEQGVRYRIFTCSMSDFFHPGADEWRDEAWSIIHECENLDWLILTKRPELIHDRLPPGWGQGYSNVWLGVTCGVRSSLPRLDVLKSIPAKVWFVSAEPLLELLDLTPYLDGTIHWIITGCEQAGVGKRREMDINWVRAIDHQCREAGIAHFFKQRYVGGKIVFDGLLDGQRRQSWPVVRPSVGRGELSNPTYATA
jgi:protein gp37